ncbi:phage tail assembly protein [Avibacterium paragallinarum]
MGSLHREDLDIINAMLSAQEIAKSTQALDQRGRLEATDKDI